MKRDVLKKVIVTEKTMKNGEYAFVVDLQATKEEISNAIKGIFGVDTAKIRTIVVKGKTKRSYKTKKSIHLTSWKKALVYLKEGQKIELFETPKSGSQTTPEVSK